MNQIQKWTLAVVSAATAMLMLDIAVVNTALSRIAQDLQTDLNGLKWVVDSYTLALATAVLSAGALADRIGRKRLFTYGLVVFTGASAACAMAGDITFLHVARAVQGLGAAVMFAVSLALLAHAFPTAKERLGAFAVYGATIGASFAVGPLVGGALTSGIDWQWIFLVNLPIGIGALVATRRYVEESRDPSASGMDWPGQITLAIGLFALVGSLLRAQQEGWGATITVAGLAVAAAALVAFVAIEARSSHPMVPLTLFRNRSFTGAQVGALAISASFFSVFLYSTIYLQQVLGLTAIQAGLVYIPGTIVNFVVAGATSQMGEKFSPRALVAGGLALVGVGQLLLTSVEVGSSWTATLPGTIVAMIGVGVFNATSTNLALSSAPPEQAGLAAGVHDTFRQAGIAVGVAALGALVPSGAGLIGSSPQAYVNGMTNALTVGGAVALVGAGATWLLIQGRRGEPAKTVVIEPRLVPQPA